MISASIPDGSWAESADPGEGREVTRESEHVRDHTRGSRTLRVTLRPPLA